MFINPQYTYDNNGNPVGVFLSISAWYKIVEELHIEIPESQKKLIDLRLQEYHSNPTQMEDAGAFFAELDREDEVHPEKKYNISRLALFGSYSRNTVVQDSDVDLMVEFNKPACILFIDLADELEEILGNKVDLVSRKAIKPAYFQHIQPQLIYV